jgi:ribonuclease P protein component
MLEKETSHRLTFKKSERLKSRKIIQALFLSNQQIKLYPFKLVWISEPNNSELVLKMGVSAPKRRFKLAVTRNLIKRKMRECIRLNKPLLTDNITNKKMNLSFMLVYIGKEVVPFSEFETKIKKILVRLNRKYNTFDNS